MKDEFTCSNGSLAFRYVIDLGGIVYSLYISVRHERRHHFIFYIYANILSRRWPFVLPEYSVHITLRGSSFQAAYSAMQQQGILCMVTARISSVAEGLRNKSVSSGAGREAKSIRPSHEDRAKGTSLILIEDSSRASLPQGRMGYKSIMENCISNAKVLTEGITKTGRFDIVSKDVGVPVVAFSLRDSSKYTVFEVSEHLRKFGWIVPAYTMPPDAEHIAVLRVVIREDFSHSLAERLVSDIEKVLKDLDTQPSRLPTKAARVTAEEVHNDKGNGLHQFHTDIVETEKDIIKHWRRIAGKKTSGVC
ncbi:glutamate decarboxylase-like [Lycium ferocissimum]|uniref:glutamate decarboxylase-like n=1 Tax=Lycium ferocissimum TaxID=112874 RepID=UPI0028169603|nr:glutamate decarboxylase-like [Lycium ferocissimum]